MKNTNCVSQRLSKYFLSGLLGFLALGLIVIGVTILPVLGIVLALPVLALSFYLFKTRLNDQCEIDFNAL